MTPEERQAEISRTQGILKIAQILIHDPGMGADVRQAARDTAVAAHTTLQDLERGG